MQVMAASIQEECEAIIKRGFDAIEESFTVDRWVEHEINGGQARRSVTWMTNDENGDMFRADCVWVDGAPVPTIWLMSKKTGRMESLKIEKTQQVAPKVDQVIEQEDDQGNDDETGTVGWRFW